MNSFIVGILNNLDTITIAIIIIGVGIKVFTLIRKEFGFGMFKEMFEIYKFGISMTYETVKEKAKVKDINEETHNDQAKN